MTVSGTGEVHCPHGLRVMGALLAVTGDQEIPVACGRGTPLVGNHAFPDSWREAADSGWGLDLSRAPAPASERTAVDLLAETLAPGGVTLLTLGPLTNVAQAFRADPDLAARASSIVVMGGAVDVAGNVFGEGLADPAVAEWNAYADPTAAAEVIASGAPVVMVGLDATNQAPVTGDFVEMLRANAHTTAASLVSELIGQNPSVHTGDAYFWDPLAAAVALLPGLVTTEQASIAVVTAEGSDSGRTIRSADGSPVSVAVDADGEVLEDVLIRALNGLGPDAPIA